ncbi:MAG: ABC transporter ATP-binding protein [Actinomycetes bacterium]
MSPMRRFVPYLSGSRLVLALALVASVGQAVAAALTPWPLKVVFDSVLGHLPVPGVLRWMPPSPGGRLTTLALLMVGVAVLQGLFAYLAGVAVVVAGQRVLARLRRDLFVHLETRALAYHARSRTGDLQSRLGGDVQAVQNVITGVVPTVANNGLALVGMVVAMTLVDWRFTALAASMLPLVYAVVRRYMTRIKEAQRAARRHEGETSAVAQEVLTAIPMVQAYQGEEREAQRYTQAVGRAQNASRQALVLQARFTPMVNVLMASAGALVVYVGARSVLSGRITPGELLVFAAYLRGMYSPVRQLAKLAGTIGVGHAAAERLGEVLDASETIPEATRPVRLASTTGSLTFDDVTVDYGSGRAAVDRVNLHLAAGTRLALVGATGSGKSSLARLVPRLLDPTSGRVLLDGIDVREVALSDLRRLVTLLSQETFLFRGTVWENIAYPDGTREQAVGAARAAGIDPVLRTLDQGYDTMVAERGATLSGGQRQCVAVARAMLRDAPILLLDEPTTGLDPGTDAVLRAALARLSLGRTTITVTHQLAAVGDYDVVAVLDHGLLREVGTHDQLLALGGAYHRLVAPASTHHPTVG